jgi:hypothetical protein
MKKHRFLPTCYGLVELSMNGSCFWEMGVLIETNLVVISLCIDGEWKAEYFPAFKGKKYTMKIGVKYIFSDKKLGFSLLVLDEKIGNITGISNIITDKSILRKKG